MGIGFLVYGLGIGPDYEIAERGELRRGPHFDGPAELLGLRSERFYATTALPLKEAGSMPPHLTYLDSPRAAGVENLSNDLGLAARNALLEMIRYLVEERGMTEDQAYALTSVRVDLRIGQANARRTRPGDASNILPMEVAPIDDERHLPPCSRRPNRPDRHGLHRARHRP